MREVSVDLETTSRADLRRVGTVRYAKDPSTQVLCASWLDHTPGSVVFGLKSPFDLQQHGVPRWVLDAAQGKCLIHAYNAAFEWWIFNEVCTRLYGWPRIPETAMRCTLARARYWGYSGSLDETSQVFGGPPKDMDGHRLMMKMAKPRRASKLRPESWWHEDEPSLLDDLSAYCDQDVRAEHGVASMLPPLPKAEQAIFEMDLRMNAVGVRCDPELIDVLHAATEQEKSELDQDLDTITAGAVTKTSQVQKLTGWVSDELGETVDSLDKEHMKELLARDSLSQHVRQALTCRKIAAKSSTAKLSKMREAMGPVDNFLRGLLQYYGAARTGRWAGRIVQPQNLPRGMVGNPIGLSDLLVLGAISVKQIAKDAGSDVMSVASSLIRCCLIADEYEDGGVLIAPDYGQIEARVIAWLAGQNDILKVFARGDDVYLYTAAQLGSDNRQYGKVCVLGLGFGMGAGTFQQSAYDMGGLELTEEQSEDAVHGWRRANPEIVAFWYELENAAWAVLRQPGRVSIAVGAGHVHVERRRNKIDPSKIDMHIVKPSGLCLVYPNLRSARHPAHGGESLCYDGLNPITGKFAKVFTYSGKLAENVTQSVARDIMGLALIRLEQWGVLGTPRLTVHDEAILNVPASLACTRLTRVCREAERVMLFDHPASPMPKWLKGLPLKAEADVKRRYAK